jgi:N utilization substance protein B
MKAERHRARIAALQALYEHQSSGHAPDSALARLLSEKPQSDSFGEYAAALIKGVADNFSAIDEQIRRFAPAWPLEQLPVVDHNILRLAIFEILFNNEVPMKVVINEAVELAKTFGSENSPRFINGVLGSVSVQAGDKSTKGG